jgi:hypothetical protein
VQQLLGSQAKLLEAQVHAAKQPAANQQQGHQERACSPLLQVRQPQQQQQQQCTQYAVRAAGSRSDGILGTSMQDFELQLQQLQLQVDNMGGEEQQAPASAPEQAAASANCSASSAEGLQAAAAPAGCSIGASQQQQQQLIDDQAATIADLKKVIAGARSRLAGAAAATCTNHVYGMAGAAASATAP